MYKIGIDIGGTKIEAILWDGKKIREIFSAKTPKTKKEFIAILKTVIKNFFKNNKKISGIGIGAAGIIGRNTIIFSPNIVYLRNFSFNDIFPHVLIRIDNDARVFLRGEMKLIKRYSKNKNVLAFTIGTGIGRAFAGDGKIKKIKNFEYPEKWEKEYQNIRDCKTNVKLIEFLADKLAMIIKKRKPEIVIIGGGVLRRKNFFKYLKTELREKFKKTSIKVKLQETKSEYSASLGAVLLLR